MESLKQKYADRMEQRSNIAINLMRDAKTSRGLKRRLPQDAYVIHIQDFLKLPHALPNVTLATARDKRQDDSKKRKKNKYPSSR